MRQSRVTTLTAFCIGALILAGVLAGGRPVTPLLARRTAMSQPVTAMSAGEDLERRKVQEAYSRLPVTFVENRGQTNQQVRYFARGSRYAFFLTPNEIVLSLTKASRTAGLEITKHVNAGAEQQLSQGITLGLRFLGANPAVIEIGRAHV